MVVPQLPINDRSCHKSPWHEFRRETPTHGKILRFGRVGPVGPPRHIAPNNPSLVEVRHQRERFLIPGDLWKMQPIMENSLITRNMEVEILSAYSNLYTVDIYQCIFNLLLYLNIGCRVTNTCTNTSNHFLFHKNQPFWLRLLSRLMFHMPPRWNMLNLDICSWTTLLFPLKVKRPRANSASCTMISLTTMAPTVSWGRNRIWIFKNSKHVPSLKLTYPLKIGLPNRKFHFPTIHFQGLC